jgi:hypothetical protein
MSTMDPTAPATVTTATAPIEEPQSNGSAAAVEQDAAPSEAPTALEEFAETDLEVVAPAVPNADPTLDGDLDESALIGLGVEAPPAPAAVAKRLVRGRYRSTGANVRVELRVDIDGPRAMKRVSADYYSVSGGTVTYVASMRLDAPTIAVTPTMVTIKGTGIYSASVTAPKVKITIPRVPKTSPPAAATLRHYTPSGAPAATFVCPFVSARFRQVLLEEDYQKGVTPFVSYDTGSLPSGGPGRVLDIRRAYAEAGIDMQATGMTNEVNAGSAGASWSDAELHAAMQAHFSRWVNRPQWAVWLLHARLHDLGTGLLGIMFDQQGRQRQGAAVFYEGLAGSTPDALRLQLYTCVHELGHCFNLLHSWQKGLATPPAPNRPGSLSWMNYPWRFPTGPADFFARFPFHFDDLEVIHLRHAFRDDVIMGGSPFAVGSALDASGWSDPEADESGLRLRLAAPRAFPYGAPVSVDLELYGTTEAGREVPVTIGPRPGLVDIAIRKPGGQMVVFDPLLHHCRRGDTVTLRAGDEPVRDSAFIHYGADGFVFDQPGIYRLRARYGAPDGSLVLSNTFDVLVQGPASAADNQVAELIFGDEQGALLSLVGSDALERGNEALQEIIERHPDHPVAAYARIVRGTNLAREFKRVEPDGSVTVRSPQPEEAMRLLDGVIEVDALRGVEPPAAAVRLTELGTKPEIPSYVDAFVRARKQEIAHEVAQA